MSAYSDSILEAIQTLSEKTASSKASTLTIECTIKAINDIGLGIYTVEYLNNTFKVFTSDSSKVYEIGDKVCVLIQNGDFSKDKYILTAVDRTSNGYTNAEKIDKHYDISDNLVVVNNNSVISLCTYQSDYETTNLLPVNQDKLKELLTYYFYDKNYNYDTLKLSCEIKTDIAKDQQIAGDYGLILNIPIKKLNTVTNTWEEDTKKSLININTILGNPYNLSTWTPQVIYIDFDKNFEQLDLLSRDITLTAFVKNFKPGTSPFIADIWIKEVNIKVSNEYSDTELSGYYLSLICESGPFFTTNTSELFKIIKPSLQINGKETSVQGHQCYWFKEDSSINRESEYFCSYGGIGWKCLNEKVATGENDDGSLNYDYKSNIYELKVNKEDVITSIKYKCIITFNEVKLTSYIVITNCEALYSVDLQPANGLYSVIKNIGSTNLICRVLIPEVEIDFTTTNLIYKWSRYDKNGEFIDNDFYTLIRNNDLVEQGQESSYYETEIKVPADIIDTLNTFSCTVYKEYINDSNQLVQKVIGTKSLSIVVTTDSQYSLSIQNANVLYKYDSDGDSPLCADYDGPVSSRITETVPLTFRLFKQGGIELSEDEYLSCLVTWKVPINSMIIPQNVSFIDDGEYHIITGTGRSSLAYTISSNFNSNKTDNTILLNIIFDNNTLEQAATILFTKEGESGTNGTKYTAVIKYINNGEAFSIGSKDAKGYYRDLKMIYHPLQNIVDGQVAPDDFHWVYLDGQPLDDYSTAYFYKKLNNTNHPTFDVSIYKDGQEIRKGTTEYTNLVDSIEYRWFDGEAGESLKTNHKILFSFGDAANNQGNQIVSGIDWVDKNEIYCNIVQVKIKLKTSEELYSTEYIYAYYPIEITLVTREETPVLYGQYDVLDRIPFIRNGFYSVLYCSDGTNPKYDSSVNFYCSEGKEEAYYRNYTWSANNNIKVTPIESSIQGITRTKECKGIPNSSWQGDTCNYIKVVSTQDNENYSYTTLIDNIMILDCNNQALEWEYDLINQEKTNGLNLLNNYITNRNEMFDCLINAKDYLNARFKCLDQLDVAIAKLKEFIETRQPFPITGYFVLQAHLNAWEEIREEYILNHFENLQINEFSQEEINMIMAFNRHAKQDGNIVKTINTYVQSYNIVAQEFEQSESALLSSLDNYNRISSFIYDLKENVKDFVNSFIKGRNFITTEVDIFDDTHSQSITDTYEVSLKTWETAKTKLSSLQYNFDDIISYNDIEKVLKNDLDACFDPIIQNGLINNYYLNFYNDKINNYYIKNIDSNNAEMNNLRWLAWQCFYTYITIRPIVCTVNRYEMSNINAWDGAKLYVDDEYLLAPQVGAGQKDSANRFTGIVIGKKNLTQTGEVKAGLYGYYQGALTIELDAAKGSAVFGKKGDGQIIMDPNGDSKIAGWVINTSSLTKGNVGISSDNSSNTNIAFWAGNSNRNSAPFRVDFQGNLICQKGTIGGWTISSDSISAGSIYLDPSGNIRCGTNWSLNSNGQATFKNIQVLGGTFSIGSNFSVSADGTLTASSAILSGQITATTGLIGGWSIQNLQIVGGSTVLSADGNIRNGNNWSLNANGTASFNGAVTVNGQLTASNVNITGGEFNINNKFKVSSIGSITAAAGTIGGWQINGQKLQNTGGTVILDPSTPQFKIGNLTISNTKLTLTSGSGNVTIENGVLTAAKISGTSGSMASVFSKLQVDSLFTYQGHTVSSHSATFLTDLNGNTGTIYYLALD